MSGTTTVHLSTDDRYPDVYICEDILPGVEPGGIAVKVTYDMLARWRAARDTYDAMQAEMTEVMRECVT